MGANRKLPLVAAAWLGSCGGPAPDQGNAVDKAAAEPGAGAVEIAAPALPTDAQIAEALEGKLQEGIWDVPEGVIPEPDGLRTVVRGVRCTALPAGGSRTRCTFEEARSPMRFTNHEEAAEWVRQSGRWTASSATFAYRSEAIGSMRVSGWRAL